MIKNQQAKLLVRYGMIALVAGTVGTFVALNCSNGGSRLARTKARLRANGEKLLLDELVTPRATTTNSIGPLAKFKDLRSRFLGSVDLMVPVAAGRARVGWRSDRGYESDAAVRGYWAELEADVEREHALLAEFREFLQGDLPRDIGWNYRDPSTMPPGYLIEKRRAGQFLAVAVLSDLHRERGTEALENVHAMIRLANIHDHDGLLVDQMIRVAIAGLGVAATWEILQAQGWSDAQLATLQTQWERLKLLERVLFGLEIERAMALEVFEQARTNAVDRQKTFSSGSSASLKGRLHGSLWKTLFAEADGLAYLNEMQACIEAARLGMRERNCQAVERHLAPSEPEQNGRGSLREAIDEWRFPVTGRMMPNVRKALRTVMKQETMREMAIAAIALNRYQLKHRQLPSTLGQLVPEFLSEPPSDYMDGRSLRYKRETESTWTLYSIGLNGIDEGGDATSPTNSPHLWQGRDVVWPHAAEEMHR